jgi:hypothetical protein
MAIKSTSVTLDGLKHNLDDRDRVGAQALVETTDVIAFQSDDIRAPKTFRDPATSGATPTNISAIALSVNTYYASIAAATAMTIPSAAAGSIGDFISIYYSVAAGNGNAHTYSCTTDTAYALGSTAVRIGGAVASAGDLSVAGDDVLTITGHTNGDGGLGTTVRFVNMTGTTNGWAVEAITTNQGTGAQAGTIAFSDAG